MSRESIIASRQKVQMANSCDEAVVVTIIRKKEIERERERMWGGRGREGER